MQGHVKIVVDLLLAPVGAVLGCHDLVGYVDWVGLLGEGLLGDVVVAGGSGKTWGTFALMLCRDGVTGYKNSR